MRTRPRFAALLAAAAFLIAALVPVAGFASELSDTTSPVYTVGATAQGSPPGPIGNAGTDYAQVAAGTPVELQVLELDASASNTPSCSWSVDKTTGSGLSGTADKPIITVTPTAAGSYKYTAAIEVDDGDENNGGETSRATAEASFTLNVVDKLEFETNEITAAAGEKVTLTAQWANDVRTATPANMTYEWSKTLADAPNIVPDSSNGLTASIQVPADLTGTQTYTYTVTPVLEGSSIEYAAAEIKVTASNTFTNPAASTVTWYLGDEQQPKLTATFASNLVAAETKWQAGSTWNPEGSALDPSDVVTTDNTSTYTVPETVTDTWTAAGSHPYVCHGVNSNGVAATAQITVNVAAPTNPSVTGAATLNNDTYASTTASGATLSARALTGHAPTLSVKAAGGTGGVLGNGTTSGSGSGSAGSDSDTSTDSGSGSAGQNSYTYTWYTCSSNSFVVNGENSGSTQIQNQSNAELPPSAYSLAPSGQTVYIACVVGVSGNTRARTQQNFAITTVDQPTFEKDTDETSADLNGTFGVGATINETLAVGWNPPVAPSDVTGYTWAVTSAPAGGTVSTNLGEMPQGTSIPATGTSARQLTVTRLSAAGTYRITCTPTSSSATRATYAPVEFTLVAGQPSFSSGTVTYYATQGTNGDIVMQPTTAVVNNAVSVAQNSRLALYIPDTSITDGNSAVVAEWVCRRSATSPEEPITMGQGFYGVNGSTLVTGPVTSSMNGMQFSLKISSQGSPDLTANSAWITMNVTGLAPSTAPNVMISSTPTAQGSTVSATAGGSVTFEATVTNTNEIPAANLTYQWYMQPAPGASSTTSRAIEGATSSVYTISNVTTEQSGERYWCVVSNSGYMNEEGRSSQLILSVNNTQGAVVISSPVSASLTNLTAGESMTFSVSAHTNNGSGVQYQWYMRRSAGAIASGTAVTSITQAQQYVRNAVLSAVPNGTSSTLTVPSFDAGVYEYLCSVTNSSDTSQTVRSASYYVAVTQAGTTPIITSPTSTTYVGGLSGQPLYLPCTAYIPSGQTPTYQWQTSSTGQEPWNDLGSYTESELRIPSLTSQNNGQYYRCVVSNPTGGSSARSAAYMVSVWDPADTPTVTSNPQAITYQITLGENGTPSSNTVSLESTATSGNISALRAQWQYRTANGSWVNVPNSTYGSSISGGAVTNGRSTLTLAANQNSQAPSGNYRCVWMTGSQAANAPLVPQSESSAAEVNIIYPGHPRITTQPSAASVHVGSTASFTVAADLGQTGDVVYIWQVSRDKGSTWNNCTTATDGTGQFTATFQTYPVTQAMYETAAAASPGNMEDSIYMYRCIVANRMLSMDVISQEVPLVILEGPATTPVIAPGQGSSITVSGSGSSRFAKGVTVTGTGTTAATFLRELNDTPPTGYTLSLLTQDGQAVPSGDIVCTGMNLVLVRTSNDQTVDTATVVVLGDVLGQGRMNLSQLVRLAAAFRGREPLSGAFYQAALLTGKSTIQLSDLVAEAAIFRQSQTQAASSTAAPATATPTASASASGSASRNA